MSGDDMNWQHIRDLVNKNMNDLQQQGRGLNLWWSSGNPYEPFTRNWEIEAGQARPTQEDLEMLRELGISWP